MRRVSALALLGAVISNQAAAGGLPRGIGPEFASHYTSATFTCITNPSIKIKSSQVNDNTCNCPDGSDEPGTAACSHLDSLSPALPLPGSTSGTTNTTRTLPGFWCANKGHIGAYVPFIHVNDGVCDYSRCCDGSEEYGGVGGVKCPDRCAEMGKEWRRLEEEKRKGRERAEKKREDMLKESAELRTKVEAKIASLKEEIKGVEIRKMELQKKYEDTEREEKGKVVAAAGDGAGGKIGILLDLAKKRVEELRNAVSSLMAQRSGLDDRIAELEGILSKFKEEYNPNFNDEGVKSAVKSWEDYAARQASETQAPTVVVEEADLLEIVKEDSEESGINWAEFGAEQLTDTDILYKIEAYLPTFARDYLHQRINSLRVWLIQNGMLADAPKGAESRVIAAAREAFEAAERDLKSKQSTLAKEESDLTKPYGPDDIFRALKSKCISTSSGEYNYEVCWLDKTTQKSKKNGAGTNMGNFDRIDWEDADEEERADGKGLGIGRRMVLRFDRGAGCWNGPQRRTDVWLACGETDEIWRVMETEKCVYRMEVGSPAACSPKQTLEEEQQVTKDEL